MISVQFSYASKIISVTGTAVTFEGNQDLFLHGFKISCHIIKYIFFNLRTLPECLVSYIKEKILN